MSGRLSSKKILLAEDDPFLSDTIRSALLEHGMEVFLAHDGEEAIAALSGELPDLILLDLLMPKKDGLEVLQHIRKNDITVPVVILSNLSADMDAERCLALGAKDYLVKSDMDEVDLWPRIQKYL